MKLVEDLEKLKQLKDSGAITDKEFEEAKQKILNSKEKNKTKKMKKSKIFFILTAILVIITTGLFIYKNSCRQKYNDYMDEHMADDIALKWNSISQIEYNKIEKKEEKLFNSSQTANTIFNVSLGTTILVLLSGITFTIIEKNKK